ncbi:type II toxin-antitoxin system VapC family toxin [Verminephrobacter aporrectodeae]|uniref:Ribonuclease VapC n=2 Tax=Verminephrobacter TaxID=364316 RepID=A0ABT3KWQ1_9BURK|nr:type II toxin-antitoxin system VapC family toxin [Verminephrobacter aporrectodeae]MCW5221871.1 type II toxin-antitoxin system VapC family toxin [Verminephrobacter aporrectodeae subsp. tuberculatae]MCW5258181.1 type II toxin-antitoxin system VapC family toxin [Verminephrobacter aporrectodeae subsp. tuberculatae]MCW5291162.1 type II toxin-antitoxin system VapC family toxin [Verminephrobacter aporrectodeae subsp. tuberculatae]MCW5322676.1 type II toxin-antitoxin system VapC family toxin [Vermin
MTRYMLDTNAASEAVRGHPAFDTRLQALAPGQWCISALTCSELRFGLAKKPAAVRLHRLVNEFLRIAPILPWDAKAANRHGELRANLQAQGLPIGDFDEMIAAHALAIGAVLVTDNVRHFSRVPGLMLENWLRSGPEH